MVDPRIERAADILVNYSTKIKKGDRVVIVADYEAASLAEEVFKKALLKRAIVSVKSSLPNVGYIYYNNADESQLRYYPKVAMYEMKNTDVWIAIGGENNTKELSNIPPKKLSIRMKTMEPILNYRVDKTRWVIFDYPTNAFAQEAEMSLPEFEDFVFNATNIDWAKERAFLNKIKARFDRAEHVRIVADRTDISMSLKGRTAIADDGEHNMPGGEVFMAPDEFTVNGVVYFSYPALFVGKEVEGIELEFKNGKVIHSGATKNEALLTQILNTDKGSRYIGELGIGANYNIRKYIKNTLFDEKIGGTIHLALGRAYKEGGGRNVSAIHWDLVRDLRKGGRIYLDGKLFQKDGKFIF